MRNFPKFRYFAIILPASILIVSLRYLSIQLETKTIMEAMHMQEIINKLDFIILESLWAFVISLLAGIIIDWVNGGRLWLKPKLNFGLGS